MACWCWPARARAKCWPKVADIDVSNAAFPWLTARPLSIGAAGVLALRVNFVGELGYELHHPDRDAELYLRQADGGGREFGIKPFGIRAMDSLRLEKSYKLVGRELSIEYAALESGLDRFIDMKKAISSASEALLDWREQGFANKLVTLRCMASTTPTRAGRSRSSRTASRSGARRRAATAGGSANRWRSRWCKPDLAQAGHRTRQSACSARISPRRVVGDSPYDPENAALRG